MNQTDVMCCPCGCPLVVMVELSSSAFAAMLASTAWHRCTGLDRLVAKVSWARSWGAPPPDAKRWAKETSGR